MTSEKEKEKDAAKRRKWLGYAGTLAIGLMLLGFYAVYLIHFPEADAAQHPVWNAVADLMLRDLGGALVIAVVVAWLFDKAYHQTTFTDPIAKLETSVIVAANEIGQFTESATAAVKLASENFSLLSKSSEVGIVALHERGKDYKKVIRAAVASGGVERCSIVGRTHKEMLGLQREGKGWLVDALGEKLKQGGFQLKILLGNPFDLEDDTSTGNVQVKTLPPRRNAARGQIHGSTEARKAIYQLLTVLAPYATSPNVDGKKNYIELRLLRSIPVPYCMLMTDKHLFVEHYLPSFEGGALPIVEIKPKELPRDPSPHECFTKDFTDLFDHGEDCVVVLRRFDARKRCEFTDEPTEVSASLRYPELEKALDDALKLARARESAAAATPEAPAETEAEIGNTTPPNSRLTDTDPDKSDSERLESPTKSASTSLLKDSRKPADFMNNRAYSSQQTAYSRIVRYIRAHDIKKAVLLQYSAVKAEDVLIELMSKGAQIDLYVQSAEAAKTDGMDMQFTRITGHMSHLPMVLKRHNPTGLGSCRVFHYGPRATLRGILLEDHLLAIGPYIYQHSPEDKSDSDDKIAIKGHDSPGSLFWYGSPEYEIFSLAFNQVIENYRKGLKPGPTIGASRPNAGEPPN